MSTNIYIKVHHFAFNRFIEELHWGFATILLVHTKTVKNNNNKGGIKNGKIHVLDINSFFENCRVDTCADCMVLMAWMYWTLMKILFRQCCNRFYFYFICFFWLFLWCTLKVVANQKKNWKKKKQQTINTVNDFSFSWWQLMGDIVHLNVDFFFIMETWILLMFLYP